MLPINLQSSIGLGLLADGLVSRTIKSNWRGSLLPFGAQPKEDRVETFDRLRAARLESKQVLSLVKHTEMACI